MKIYLLEQGMNTDWDTYDSVVVIAENESDARNIHPSDFVTHIKDGKWMGTYSKGGEYDNNDDDSWVGYERIGYIKATYIGEAKEGQERGVLLASFNAG